MADATQTYVPEKARRAVQIVANDGTVVEGNLVVPKTRAIAEILNGRHPFLEFETTAGERIYISKPSIRSVKALDYPRPLEQTA